MSSGKLLMPLALVGGGVALFLMSGESQAATPVRKPTGKKGKGKGKKPAGGGSERDPFLQPIPVPATAEEWAAIDDLLCLCYQDGIRNDEALTRCALQRQYPMVPWPAQDGDHPSLQQAYDLFLERSILFFDAITKEGLEEVCPGAAPREPTKAKPKGGKKDDDDPSVIGNLLETLISSTPKMGRFYQVRAGDNPTKVARQAAGLPSGSSQTPNVIRCMTRSKWNTRLYGAPQQTGYRVTHDGVTWGLNRAFLPRHQDAVQQMAMGNAPVRTIHWNNSAGHNGAVPKSEAQSFGLIWIPSMPRFGPTSAWTCPSDTPSDPRLNPPQELLDALGITIDDL